MNTTATTVMNKLSMHKFPLHNEKLLQVAMAALLPEFTREYRLDEKSIIDLYHEGIGIEIKIKGSRREIYRQVERYCKFPLIKVLILVTNRAMGLPEKINSTQCLVLNIGRAWL